MENIKINSIVQKKTKVSSKKGTIQIKFRSAFQHPLTNKRREFISDWYTVKETYDNDGKLIISNQLNSIVQRDMQNLANKLYQDISKVQLISKDNLTIQNVWNEWHDDRITKKKVAPKTLAGEIGRFNNHITRFIPRDSLLKNIRSELIQSLLDNLYPLGNHKRIAQSIKSDLSSIYNFAVKKNYILPEQNPMPYVTVEEKGLSEQLEQLENNNIENHYLEKDELNEVLMIVRKYNQQYARILEFQVLTGMRIGEVLGLKSSAISFETGLATILGELVQHMEELPEMITREMLRINKVIELSSYHLKLFFYFKKKWKSINTILWVIPIIEIAVGYSLLKVPIKVIIMEPLFIIP